MDVQPIRSDADHSDALATIDRLWGAAEGSEDADRLDVLLALVESYEDRRWPVPFAGESDPVDLLHFAITELGHTQAELAELLGSRSRASEVLLRRRALTVGMIHRISEAWRLPAELLVRPYRLRPAA
jgi:HTH-type transcriptional regulator/antitoxin HigA